MLTMIPWRLVGWLALAAGIAAGGFKAGSAWVMSDWDKERAEQTAQALESAQEAQRITVRLNTKSQEVQDAYAKRAQVARADAAAARSELDSLLDTLKVPTGADPSQATSGVAGAAAVYSDVLGSCASALTRMAAEADERGEKLTALQQWVKGVIAK